MLARIMDPIAWDRSREGAYPKVDQLRRVQRQEAIRFVERLYAAGYAVVKLPDMVVDQDGFSTWTVPQTDDRPGTVRVRRTDGRIDYTGVYSPFDANTAEALGAAAIAAARYVQEENNG